MYMTVIYPDGNKKTQDVLNLSALTALVEGEGEGYAVVSKNAGEDFVVDLRFDEDDHAIYSDGFGDEDEPEEEESSDEEETEPEEETEEPADEEEDDGTNSVE